MSATVTKKIKIVVMNEALEMRAFIMKPTTQLDVLIAKYRSASNTEVHTAMFDGIRIKSGDTPMSLGMMNLAVIEIYSRQNGG